MKFLILLGSVILFVSLLVSCIPSEEEEKPPRSRYIEAVIVEEDEEVIELPEPRVRLNPWDLMFYCGHSPCKNSIQTVRVVNETEEEVLVLEPIIEHMEGSGQVPGCFTIASIHKWPVTIPSQSELEIEVEFHWLVYQQGATLIIPVDDTLLECNLSGKLF